MKRLAWLVGAAFACSGAPVRPAGGPAAARVADAGTVARVATAETGPAARAERTARWRKAEARRRARLELTAAECGLATAVRSLTASSQCVTCHDEQRLGVPYAGGCHPISIGYDLARLAHPSLRPMNETPAEIVLYQGREVVCTSCHDGGSPQPAHVAVTMRQSALCLACHDR